MRGVYHTRKLQLIKQKVSIIFEMKVFHLISKSVRDYFKKFQTFRKFHFERFGIFHETFRNVSKCFMKQNEKVSFDSKKSFKLFETFRNVS